jgi:hypothetical protein
MSTPVENNEYNGLHYSIKDNPKNRLPQKIVFLPLEVEVYEVNAQGQIELVPEWSDKAKGFITAYQDKFWSQQKEILITPTPVLTESEQASVNQHTALLELVTGNIFHYWYPFKEWRAKFTHPDPCIGNGLNWLVKKSGADAAVFVYANDYVSTKGRIASNIANAFWGIHVPLGSLEIVMGIVDLQTGDILWVNMAWSKSAKSLKEEMDVMKLMDEIYAKFPFNRYLMQ